MGKNDTKKQTAAVVTPTKKPASSSKSKSRISPAIQRFLDARNNAKQGKGAGVTVKAERSTMRLFPKFISMWRTHDESFYLAMSDYDRPVQDTILKAKPWAPESEQWLFSIRNTKKDEFGPPRIIKAFTSAATSEEPKVYSYWLYNGKKTYEQLVQALQDNNFIKGRGFTVQDLDYKPYDTHLIDTEIAAVLIAEQHQEKPGEQDDWYFGTRYSGLTMDDFWQRDGLEELLEDAGDSQNAVQDLA